MTWNTWIWIGSECSKWPTCFWANCKPVLHHCVKNSKTVTLLQNPDNQNFKALGRKTKLVHFYLVFYGGIPSIFFLQLSCFEKVVYEIRKWSFQEGKIKNWAESFFIKMKSAIFCIYSTFFVQKKRRGLNKNAAILKVVSLK